MFNQSKFIKKKIDLDNQKILNINNISNKNINNTFLNSILTSNFNNFNNINLKFYLNYF